VRRLPQAFLLGIPSRHLPLQGVRHALDCAHDADDVLETVMRSAREDELGEPELTDSPHPLEEPRVKKGYFTRL